MWICGHELAFFMSENLYLDHGDVPYNQDVKKSGMPMLTYLIDEATYKERFTPDLGLNITDLSSPAGANVGLSAQ